MSTLVLSCVSFPFFLSRSFFFSLCDFLTKGDCGEIERKKRKKAIQVRPPFLQQDKSFAFQGIIEKVIRATFFLSFFPPVPLPLFFPSSPLISPQDWMRDGMDIWRGKEMSGIDLPFSPLFASPFVRKGPPLFTPLPARQEEEVEK